MVRPIREATRSRMRSISVALMEDTCVRLATSSVKDSYGQVKRVNAPAATYRCKYSPGQTAEQYGGPTDERTSVVTTPTIWLPLSADGVVGAKDRLQLTHRYGQALGVPLTFEIVGDPQTLLTSVKCELRRVTL